MRITKHASIRMQERGLKEADIQMILSYGKCLVNKHDASKNTWVLNGKRTDYYVVCNSDNTVVITLWVKERT